MQTLQGVWGHAPWENFEELHSLRLNLKAFLVINHPLMLLCMDAGIQNFLSVAITCIYSYPVIYCIASCKVFQKVYIFKMFMLLSVIVINTIIVNAACIMGDNVQGTFVNL